MNASTAYQFLKPSLEGMTEEEREELGRLITGKPAEKPKRKAKVVDPVHSEEYYEKQLLQIVFKSRIK